LDLGSLSALLSQAAGHSDPVEARPGDGTRREITTGTVAEAEMKVLRNPRPEYFGVEVRCGKGEELQS
jgi:hypothetical protein